jgi:hypothetical protein
VILVRVERRREKNQVRSELTAQPDEDLEDLLPDRGKMPYGKSEHGYRVPGDAQCRGCGTTFGFKNIRGEARRHGLFATTERNVPNVCTGVDQAAQRSSTSEFVVRVSTQHEDAREA